MWNDGRVQPLVERGTDWLAGYLSDHEDIILEKVQARSWRWLPKWVDRAVARKITDGLIDLLTELRDPRHPWRGQLASAVESLIVQLAEDQDFRRRGEVLKRRLLDDPRLNEHMRKLWATWIKPCESQNAIRRCTTFAGWRSWVWGNIGGPWPS